MNIEREPNNQHTQAPPGTYEFLEQIGDYWFTDPKNDTHVSVRKEPVCAETGGSCMDLVVSERADVGGLRNYQNRHAHITQGGMIVRLSTYLPKPSSITGCDEEAPTPDIKDMIATLKNVLSRENVEKYQL